jgi:aminoglycoside phosphotransferase
MIDHPAFSGLPHASCLSGFSGAIIGLVQTRQSAIQVVRKASTDPSGSARLKVQARLQHDLAQQLSPDILVPRVLDEGTSMGHYWYDMERIIGVDAVEYLATGNCAHALILMDLLRTTLYRLSAATPNDHTTVDLQAAIGEKLAEIDSRTREKYLRCTDAIRAAITGHPMTLPASCVHGDMTLENIFIDQEQRIWLIDTIPSPFQHYWIDISKLFQDLQGRWFMNRGKSIPVGVTRYLSDELANFAGQLRPDYARWHGPLLALTFARILPYCRSAKDIEFISSRISTALTTRP